MEKLLTVQEVADILGVTPETVRRWLRDGKIEGVMLSRKAGWRVKPESLAEFVEGKPAAA